VAVCCAGGILGLAVASAISVRAASLLFHVSPLEPWVVGNALTVMAIAILAAAAIPAWRALRSDPKVAMESE
jgi:ABC-type antimicrobial peptide transport system permease subunit